MNIYAFGKNFEQWGVMPLELMSLKNLQETVASSKKSL